MWAEIAALLGGQISPAIRRALTLAIVALIALAFVGVALLGLAFALFLALRPALGGAPAALCVAGAALVLAALTSLPLWLPPRPPPPPPPASRLLELALTLGVAFMAGRRGRRERP